MCMRRLQLNKHVEDWKEYSCVQFDKTEQFGRLLKFDILDVVTPSPSVVQSETISTVCLSISPPALLREPGGPPN